jgi:hypothetical protein
MASGTYPKSTKYKRDDYYGEEAEGAEEYYPTTTAA